MFEGIKKFITKIQSAPEPVRKRWLVLLSGVSMTLIIGLWVLYINFVVDAAESGLALQDQEEKNSPGFGTTFVAGFNIVGEKIGAAGSGLINRLREKLGETNSIEIQGSERDFILEGLEKIPQTPLP